MEREVGGGIGMGKTCKLKDVSFQCMTKFTTNKKKRNVSYLQSEKIIFAIGNKEALLTSVQITKQCCPTKIEKSLNFFQVFRANPERFLFQY